MPASVECFIQTFWQSELAITAPQLHHNFTKRLNFLPSAPLSACAALQDTATRREGREGRIHLIQREELSAPTVSCTVEQSTPLHRIAHQLAWDKVSAAMMAAQGNLPVRPDLLSPPLLLLFPQFENGLACVFERSSEADDGSALPCLPECGVVWCACLGKVDCKT